MDGTFTIDPAQPRRRRSKLRPQPATAASVRDNKAPEKHNEIVMTEVETISLIIEALAAFPEASESVVRVLREHKYGDSAP